MVAQPPATGDTEAIKRAPTEVDPAIVKRPPASAAQADRDAAGPEQVPARPSREDDCKGPADLCKQGSAR